MLQFSQALIGKLFLQSHGWLAIAGILATWQTATILWRYWWKAPSGIIIAAWPTPVGRWLTALRLTFDSEALLQRAYDASNGKPFAIPATDRWLIFVTDRNQLKELDREPASTLSMEDALHELAYTEPILGPYQSAPEHKGPKSESFRVMVKVLKSDVRSSIPDLSSSLLQQIEEAVAAELHAIEANRDSEGWHSLRLMPALLRIFTRVNLLIFLGEEQANHLEVYAMVMTFFWSCVRAFMIVNLLPGPLLLLVKPFAMGWGAARKRMYTYLLRLTRTSLQCTNGRSDNPKKSAGFVAKWIAQETKFREATEVAKITLGLLFASAFQVPLITQFCLYNYCQNPEYHDKLVEEAEQCANKPLSLSNSEMPYLDSFIRETARLSPGPILSAPRTVMKPFTSSQGYRVPSGNWIAIPQLAVMRDENIWPSASTFQGFRFVDTENETSIARFTHPSYEFPFWGSIKHACPARFYVSAVMKMIISHLITHYDLQLEHPTKKPYLTMGSTRLPNPFTTILLRRKGTSE